MCTRHPGSPYGPTFPQWLYDYIDWIAVTGTPPRHLFDLTEFENVLERHVESFRSIYGPCSCSAMPSQVKQSFWEALTAVVQRALENIP
jgi:hypothetical protein